MSSITTITVENILQQVEQLPPPEQFRLRVLLNEKPLPARTKPPRDKRLPNAPWPEGQLSMDWLREHAHEYPGQWLALAGDRLVAHAPDRAAVRAAAEAAGLSADQVLLHRVAAPDEPPFMGI